TWARRRGGSTRRSWTRRSGCWNPWRARSTRSPGPVPPWRRDGASRHPFPLLRGARPELLLERGPGARQFIPVQRARRVAVLDELDEVVVPLAQAEEPRAGALLPRHALHPFPRGCVLVEAVRRNDAAGREEASPRLVHRTHALRIAAIPIRVKEPGRRRSPPAGRAAAAGPRSPARRSGSRAKASRRAPRRSGGSAPARSPCRWVWS